MGKKFKLRHIAVKIKIPRQCLKNTVKRCYYCKKEFFSKLKRIAAKKGIDWVIDASNKDDLGDFRPGRKALKELGIRSPLQEAGFTKKDIRVLSSDTGLDTWNKPAFTCLATRIPYGRVITPGKIAMVEAAEQYLQKQGFLHVRLRHHGEVARIEVEKGKIPALVKKAGQISNKLKELGFRYIAVDLDGYHQGSFNPSAEIPGFSLDFEAVPNEHLIFKSGAPTVKILYLQCHFPRFSSLQRKCVEKNF